MILQRKEKAERIRDPVERREEMERMREHIYSTQDTNRGRYTIRGEDEGIHLQHTVHQQG